MAIQSVKVTIEKLVFGGQGLGRADQKVVFAWNALPGEEVDVKLNRSKKNFAEGIAETILQPSPDRCAPLEPHWLSCSPWQILAWPSELLWKQKLAGDVYRGIGKLEVGDDLPIVTNDIQLGYRNKMEFSFYEHDAGGVQLAFHQRGQHWKQPIATCVLATPAIQAAAASIVQWVNACGFTRRDLKTVIVRSNQAGETCLAIFLKTKPEPLVPPVLSATMVGCQIYYSEPRSPASVPTELLYSEGATVLTDTVLGTPLTFGQLGFFQVNVPVFEQALKAIIPWLEREVDIVDYYSGVGAISLPLRQYYRRALLVESNVEATASAQVNIKLNACTDQCEAVCVTAEAMTEVITADKIIILDPPRVGLHAKVVEQLLAVKPRRIIYMSCNLSSQARDLQLLSSAYTVRTLQLFNFFPRTPHIEGLAVLDVLG